MGRKLVSSGEEAGKYWGRSWLLVGEAALISSGWRLVSSGEDWLVVGGAGQ